MQSGAPNNEPETLVEYVHPEGPLVTHVRGTMLVNAAENLKTWGVYDRYLELLQLDDRIWLVSTLATSWVPIETADAHYTAVGKLSIPDASVEEAAERTAERIAEMYLSKALRGGDRTEAYASMLRSYHKNWERRYRGGACFAWRLGPAHFLREDHGCPLVRHQTFRVAYLAYQRKVASLFRPDCRIEVVPPSRSQYQ